MACGPVPGASRAQSAAETSALEPTAWLALVCSVLGVGFACSIGWAFSLLAVVLGVLGVDRVNRNPQRRGKILAWTAIVLGLIPFVLVLSFFAVTRLL